MAQVQVGAAEKVVVADTNGDGVAAVICNRSATSVYLGSDTEAIQATLQTNLAGNDNDLTYTARTPGTWGNALYVEYVVPATASWPLSVDVVGTTRVQVTVATDLNAVASSTAQEVMDLVNRDEEGYGLVTVKRKAGNDGTGIVAALSPTALSGGIYTTTASGYELKQNEVIMVNVPARGVMVGITASGTASVSVLAV